MSSKVLNLIGGLKKGTPTSAAHRKLRDRLMYGRKGVTMGQHMDEFDDFRDEQGRSFDELVYFLLFNETKVLAQPPPKPPVSEAGLSQKGRLDADEYMNKLLHAHLPEIQKRIVPNPDLKRKRNGDDEQSKKAKVKTQVIDRNTAPKIASSTGKKTNARKGPNTRRYI